MLAVSSAAKRQTSAIYRKCAPVTPASAHRMFLRRMVIRARVMLEAASTEFVRPWIYSASKCGVMVESPPIKNVSSNLILRDPSTAIAVPTPAVILSNAKMSE